MLQCAWVFAGNIPDFVKKDLRRSCHGHKVDYIFESGKMTNQFVIEIIGDDKITGKWERMGLRLWWREKIVSVWESGKNVCGTLLQLRASTVGVVSQLQLEMRKTK